MKYSVLFDYIEKNGKDKTVLTFEEIGKIAGIPLDHSFLRYKNELTGYSVKISMKEQTVVFEKNSRKKRKKLERKA